MVHGICLKKSGKKVKKTIKEWICTIKDHELRALAFELMDTAPEVVEHISFYEAISWAFTWNDTKDGFGFWLDVAEGKRLNCKK